MNNSLILLLAFGLLSCAQLKKLEQKIGKQIEAREYESRALNLSWTKNLDPIHSSGNLPIGMNSPFVSEDILYIGDLSGYMHAYDLNSGRVIWEVNEKHSFNSMANRFENSVLYGSKNGRFFSRNYLTGKLNYSVDLGAPIESQPVVSQGRAIIHLRNHTIVTLDAKTGKIFWRYKRSVPYTTTLQRVSKVLSIKNRLIVGFADGYVASLSLEEGAVVWEQKISTGFKFVDVDATPVLFNNRLVVGSASGPVRYLNLSNGGIETTIEFTLSHTPYKDKNSLIAGSVLGEIYRIDKVGKILKQKKLSENSISSVSPYKIGFIVTTMGSEIFYLNKDFGVIEKFNLGTDQSAVFGEVSADEDVVSLYSSRNRLYVFK